MHFLKERVKVLMARPDVLDLSECYEVRLIFDDDRFQDDWPLSDA